MTVSNCIYSVGIRLIVGKQYLYLLYQHDFLKDPLMTDMEPINFSIPKIYIGKMIISE